eukprot:NODE_2846_length_2132_cov_10.574065.p1 GENE.NODE_2846_length_2132_cov_10.574065~~NODE_2846_length_2132_cov_10.574065.p1  ORF type:complete len:630 (-),score=134.15 NODE_2846_length_2132_cov_10.574065:241-1920(-)
MPRTHSPILDILSPGPEWRTATEVNASVQSSRTPCSQDLADIVVDGLFVGVSNSMMEVPVSNVTATSCSTGEEDASTPTSPRLRSSRRSFLLRRPSSNPALEDASHNMAEALSKQSWPHSRSTRDQSEMVGQFVLRTLKQPSGARFFVESSLFVGISSAAILANTAYMGYDAETRVTNELKRHRVQMITEIPEGADVAFTAFFVVELLLRTMAERRNFLCGEDVSWNVFDTILIASSLFEVVADKTGLKIGFNLSVFRIFRIFRLFRLMKILRSAPFLSSLNVMVGGIVNSFPPLLWACFLLLVIMYGFAVFFMSAAVSFLVSKDPGEEASQVEALEANFGTIYRTIAVLFEGVTGGRDWGELSLPMKFIHEAYYIVFAVYIVFITLGVLNIVTGFFVDGTIQSKSDARDEFIGAAAKRKSMATDLLHDIFTVMDSDQSGTLSYLELETHLHSTEVQRVFAALDFELTDAAELFEHLDYLGTGEVSIDDFTRSLLRISGTMNTNMEICNMIGHAKRLSATVQGLSQQVMDVSRSIDRISESIGQSSNTANIDKEALAPN